MSIYQELAVIWPLLLCYAVGMAVGMFIGWMIWRRGLGKSYTVVYSHDREKRD